MSACTPTTVTLYTTFTTNVVTDGQTQAQAIVSATALSVSNCPISTSLATSTTSSATVNSDTTSETATSSQSSESLQRDTITNLQVSGSNTGNATLSSLNSVSSASQLATGIRNNNRAALITGIILGFAMISIILTTVFYARRARQEWLIRRREAAELKKAQAVVPVKEREKQLQRTGSKIINNALAERAMPKTVPQKPSAYDQNPLRHEPASDRKHNSASAPLLSADGTERTKKLFKLSRLGPPPPANPKPTLPFDGNLEELSNQQNSLKPDRTSPVTPGYPVRTSVAVPSNSYQAAPQHSPPIKRTMSTTGRFLQSAPPPIANRQYMPYLSDDNSPPLSPPTSKRNSAEFADNPHSFFALEAARQEGRRASQMRLS